MRPASCRPSGVRLRGWPPVKIRGLHMGGRPGDWVEHGWRGYWITFWDWDGLQADVDFAKTLGVNTLKLPADLTAYMDGGSTQATMDSHLRQFCDYVAAQGMLLAPMQPMEPWFNETDYTAGLAAIVELLATFDDYPNVVGFDCMNELNFKMTAGEVAANCAALFPLLRDVSSIPLTASLNGSPAARDAYVDALDPWVDFHDFHIYSMGDPAMFDAYRAKPYARPFLVGEYGLNGYSDPADTTTQIANFGHPVSDAADCYGTVLFPEYDISIDAGYPGLADPDTFTAHAGPAAAFAALPGWT